ncbi:16S rRNA (uracil(1498)-N(3))-methyltransferase [Salinibacterium sp. ZJ450]|uniref:16S rRNA (uracil(1498)-N(3))-methyltransferase n=1 Tax=Salinibacterium sp. ZJ450 TaxID=2708338 RepID=UPI001421839C|nr:16S rRNA (uracil(1498)-N(3))-methyltransferase [Salinibacterium sp. ZJ450]
MAHFYLNEALQTAVVGGTVELTGAEAKHAVTVSRMRVGEQLSIGNGTGLVVNGEITEADAARLALRVETVTELAPPTPRLALAQALAKGDRDELAVQAATELGIDAVLPWAAQRSISRWEGQKLAKGRERWASIVREATKQSMRAWLPEVTELHSTKQLAARPERLIVLDPTGEIALTELFRDGGGPDERDLLLVVGPEGGIAPAELDLLRAGGASVVRLGEHVLRTSTAGPAAVAVLSAMLGRW